MRGLRELGPLARRLAASQPATAQWQGAIGSSSVLLQQLRQVFAWTAGWLAPWTRLSPSVGLREHGGGVPEFWGKESKYTAGTNFLGTPQDHYSVRAGSLGLA